MLGHLHPYLRQVEDLTGLMANGCPCQRLATMAAMLRLVLHDPVRVGDHLQSAAPVPSLTTRSPLGPAPQAPGPPIGVLGWGHATVAAVLWVLVFGQKLLQLLHTQGEQLIGGSQFRYDGIPVDGQRSELKSWDPNLWPTFFDIFEGG